MAPARVIQIGIPYLVLFFAASTQPELLIAEYITAPNNTWPDKFNDLSESILPVIRLSIDILELSDTFI
jgi:hypothetical protein